MTAYMAHSSEDRTRFQPLLDHLRNVAEEASVFAAPFGGEDCAHLIGMCHDIGKYSKKAQRRICEDGPRVDHATAGGIEIARLLPKHFAFPVMGHHGGMPDGGGVDDSPGYATLASRLDKSVEDYSAFASEIKLCRPAQCPSPRPVGEDTSFTMAFLLRMLFSCLVDADFLDTERFMRGVQRGGYDDIPTLEGRMRSYIERFKVTDVPLYQKRNEILQNCLERAQGEMGLYGLTVPTGGGKTIASLAFALAHAKKHGLERVIYVIPYTSIIEQNAGVFADIVGKDNVLEHHAHVQYDASHKMEDEDGQASWPDAHRKHLSCENWDAPLVVTTNVQFFESLFSNRTSRCRKLHNIARSVIVFDEAQMLPVPYLRACVRAIEELTHNYGCTALLCSATQPQLAPFFTTAKSVQITEDVPALYSFFKRAQIHRLGDIDDAALAARLGAHEQVLCIVNTRKHAQVLYALLPAEGSYHLSTLMYPLHRKRMLGEIRDRLKAGLPCRVVSTSLIEAGVDVDFPVVYRAETGLDSIVQAAGRCNREGKNPLESSFVYVFVPLDHPLAPKNMLKRLATITDMVAQKHGDIAAPEAIDAYFERIYAIADQGGETDQHDVLTQIERGWKNNGLFPFRKIAESFKLIDAPTRTVLIPEGDAGEALLQPLRSGWRNRTLMRDVGQRSVQIYQGHFDDLYAHGALEILDEELAVLATPANYSQAVGLTLTPAGGNELFS